MEQIVIYSLSSAGRGECLPQPKPEPELQPESQTPLRPHSESPMKPHPETPLQFQSITIEALAEAIAAALRQIKVYVVESEITEAQQAVRAVVERSHF